MQACTIFAARDLQLVEHEAPSLVDADSVRVDFATGGICGSDIHYYQHGGVGSFTLKEPLILGHEVAGVVRELGSGVDDLSVGQPVAINPNLPCLACENCLAGRTNLCRDMVFFGSAAVMPHIQGGFREQLVVPRRQCVALPDGFDLGIAVFAEPLAVCLHAVNQAGLLSHSRVLVTGCGPIGCLTIQAAKLAGVAHVTATDLEQRVLDMAEALGADETLRLDRDAARIKSLQSGRGEFDAAFECSGNPNALATCLKAVKPAGSIVQVGMLPPTNAGVAINPLITKELRLIGCFRFHDEFDIAVDALVRGRLDVSSLLTGIFDFRDADAAFAAAADRSQHMKVQLRFS